MTRLRSIAMAGALLAAAGCAGAELESAAREVRKITAAARENGAYNCAPRELALAETETEFAEKRLDHGDYFGAKGHLQTAERNAREAFRLSPKERCAPGVGRPGPEVVKRLDTDRDGITDDIDRCPTEPEDKDAFEDEDGCPDPDNDHDGIPDVKDKCPLQAEDRDGFEDQDGCPEPDNDQDGLLDPADTCPNEPEDKDGFEDADGCPDPDNDKDTVLDAADRCPTEPGPPDNGGCPKKFEHIVVTSEKIELKQKIFFETNKATIMVRSYALLNEVVTALKDRPTMRLRIEGHTDSRGSPKLNTRLSQARADSVRDYLIGHGVDRARLETVGFGPDQPIETNKTGAGRERNRRVEFFITQP